MVYNFGRSSFATFLWIKNGDLFSNVTLVEIEMINTGAFRLEVVNEAGKVISSGLRDNPHGGWSTFNFSAGMNPPVTSGMSPYKLRLSNESPGTRNVLQGNVHS